MFRYFSFDWGTLASCGPGPACSMAIHTAHTSRVPASKLLWRNGFICIFSMGEKKRKWQSEAQRTDSHKKTKGFLLSLTWHSGSSWGKRLTRLHSLTLEGKVKKKKKKRGQWGVGGRGEQLLETVRSLSRLRPFFLKKRKPGLELQISLPLINA